ncbi:MAG: hypothetical protein ACYC4F_09605, partial [Armatimonadota bacterium]
MNTLDLETSVYTNKRPKLTAGPDIAHPEIYTGLDLYSCREIMIQEIRGRHFSDGMRILDGKRPWIAVSRNSELSPMDRRVFHATVGALGALLAPAGMMCAEPMVREIRIQGTPMVAYAGYPAWALHPALAGLHTYGLRLAYFILEGGMRDKFLDLLPHRRARITGAIRRKDTDYLLRILRVMEDSLTNLHLDWETMNTDDR